MAASVQEATAPVPLQGAEDELVAAASQLRLDDVKVARSFCKVFAARARAVPAEDALAHDELALRVDRAARVLRVVAHERAARDLRVRAATFAADNNPAHLLHAVYVPATIARGRVTRLDTAAAEAHPGVTHVITPANRPPLQGDPEAKHVIRESFRQMAARWR